MFRNRFYVISSLVLGCTGSAAALAQSQLEEIVVTGTRMETQLREVPLAISLIDNRSIQLGRQELGLDESLNRVPGLFMQNRYNFTQDLKVSIRGFGSRSSFGIRGIKVYADGIPVTLADGQSGTDDLDIGSAERIEVVRGPSAALYGTAAGGVISITSEEGPAEPFIETKLTFGEFGQQKYQFKTGGQTGDLNYMINTSHLEMDGHRDHSEVQHSLINTKFRYTIDANSDIVAIVNAVNSPTANDAGGLTRADAAVDPTQAQIRNSSSNAGESFDQQRIGLVYNNRISENHDLTLRGYSLWKDFETFLPIGTHIPFVADDGVSAFDRIFFGGGARYTYSHNLMNMPSRLTVGFDVDIQEDERQRFLNHAGVKGALVFDQLEKAESLGIYVREELDLTETVTFNIGGRFDNLDMSVDDYYLVNGDQSATLDYNEFSPSVGVMWNASTQLNLYANYATSFETPTFTELGTPAQDFNVNLGGFSDVDAQEAKSFEVGARGDLTERVFYELALYTMEVTNEITNVESIGNRAFFRNSDTDRYGLEAQVQADILDNLGLVAAYTYSHFTFDSFDTEPAAVGEWVPGIPRHQFYTELDYTHSSGAYVIWDALFVGKYYADNANTDKVDSYWVSNIRAGNDYEVGDTIISPFFGINNLFDEDYFANVRANSFGGRAFEPAPERHVYGGVNIRF